MRISRYLTHAVVLAVAVTLSGYASLDRHFPSYFSSRLGTVNAEAVIVGEGGNVGDVNLGRASTIIKPVAIPVAAPVSHSSTSYVVQAGDDLSSIATKFQITVPQLRWSNPDLLTDTDAIRIGAKLVIPPVPGVAVRVKAGDTLDGLAAKYHVDVATIMDYNRLRDSQLPAGSQLVIPGGVGPDFPVIPPPFNPYLARTGTGWNSVILPYVLGPYPATGFPVGWCTYYVATMRNVTWRGNAGEWYDNARAQGVPVGATPQVGSIMVTWESYLGHVAYVVKVNPDGSWVVNEMNAPWWNTISQRTVTRAQMASGLVGFIYGQ